MMNFTTRMRLLMLVCEDPGFTECLVASWLWNTVPVILLTLGTVGNILSMIVLSRRKFRHVSTMMYMMFLTGSDLVVLWSSLLRNTLSKSKTIDIKDLSEFSCRVHEWVSYTAGAFSGWLLVLLTMERVIYAKCPIFAKMKMTHRNAIIASAVTLIVISILNGFLLVSFRLVDVPVLAEQHQNLSTIHYTKKCYFASEDMEYFYNVNWTVIIFIIYNVIPLLIIVVGNYVVARAVFRHRRQVQPVMNKDSTTSLKMNSVTRTLFVLSIYFVLTSVPFCIFTLLVIFQYPDPSPREFARLQLGDAVVYIVLWSGFTFNFVLYSTSGSNFKQECAKMLTDLRNSITSIYWKSKVELSST